LTTSRKKQISLDDDPASSALTTEAEDLAARINEESMILGGGPIVAASVEWE